MVDDLLDSSYKFFRKSMAQIIHRYSLWQLSQKRSSVSAHLQCQIKQPQLLYAHIEHFVNFRQENLSKIFLLARGQTL